MSRPAPGAGAPPARSLLSRLAHALGTPLGSVQISAELLARDPGDRLGERERRLVDNIRHANAEVQELLRQVGRLVRAREGRLRLLVEEVDAGELLAEVGRRLAASLGERAAAVEVGAAAPALRLLADRGVLAEVVESLAAVLLPAGGETAAARVRVTVEPAAAMAGQDRGGEGAGGADVPGGAAAGERGGGSAPIGVDTAGTFGGAEGGPGASAAAGAPGEAPAAGAGGHAALVVAGTGGVPRLAEPDFEPLADAGPGAVHGLALALARALVEAQDGSLAVEPRADGTAFRLVLPLAERSSPAEK